MPLPIPFYQPDITQQDIDSVSDVLALGVLSGGTKLERFETLVAKAAGRRHGVGVSSGTAGLDCARVPAGGGPGGEVFNPPFLLVRPPHSRRFVVSQPRFVDMRPGPPHPHLRYIPAP